MTQGGVESVARGQRMRVALASAGPFVLALGRHRLGPIPERRGKSIGRISSDAGRTELPSKGLAAPFTARVLYAGRGLARSGLPARSRGARHCRGGRAGRRRVGCLEGG